MLKKLSVVLMSAVLLTACGQGDNGGSSSEETSTTTNEETTSATESFEEETTSQADATENSEHVFDKLITEETFTNENGYVAWEHYKAVEESVTLGDGTTFTEDTIDLTTIEGTSTQEITDQYDALVDSQTVLTEVDSVPGSSAETFQTFDYPPEEGSDVQAEYLAQNAYLAAHDNTYFMAIANENYDLEVDHIVDEADLESVETISDLAELNPSIYSVGKMNIGGTDYNQVMFPTVGEDGVIDATYYFVQNNNDDIYYYVNLSIDQIEEFGFAMGASGVFFNILPDMIVESE